MRSLFERLGSEAAVQAAVVKFYDRMLADPELAPFFEGMNVERLVDKQIAFMTMAFDGPNRYTGRDLRVAHARLVEDQGLSDHHFDRTAEHLVATLQELSVEQPLIDEAIAIVASTRDDVLGRTPA